MIDAEDYDLTGMAETSEDEDCLMEATFVQKSADGATLAEVAVYLTKYQPEN